MKGYYTSEGYMGWILGQYVLFATESDYVEFFLEYYGKKEESK